MIKDNDRKGLIEHLDIECENICEALAFESYITNEQCVVFSSKMIVGLEESQLTREEWLDKLEYVHSEIAASIKRYKDQL